MSVINATEAPPSESTTDVSTDTTTDTTNVGTSEGEVSEGTSDSTNSEGELILGKFKTQDDLIDSYKELTTKLREKQPEAPEEYTFDFAEHEVLGQHKELVDSTMAESALISTALDKFKEHNISQDVASDILTSVLAADIESMGEEATNEDIIADLGSEAETIITEVNQYVGRFPANEQAVLEQLGTSAEGVRLVHKLSKMGGSKPIPTKADTAPAKSSADYLAEAAALKKDMGGDLQFNSPKVAEYEALMNKAIEAEEREKNR